MPTNKPENTTSGTQGHVASTDQLGPLPEPYTRQWINAPFTERLLFTEEQMHAYARECVVSATAECSAAWQAKLADVGLLQPGERCDVCGALQGT